MANNTTTSALTETDIYAAMSRSAEGFAIEVVESLECELQRKLTDGECQRVFWTVSRTIVEGCCHDE